MSKLILGDKVIWENRPGLTGFFGIKLRKQRNEIRAVQEMEKRIKMETEAETETRKEKIRLIMKEFKLG